MPPHCAHAAAASCLRFSRALSRSGSTVRGTAGSAPRTAAIQQPLLLLPQLRHKGARGILQASRGFLAHLAALSPTTNMLKALEGSRPRRTITNLAVGEIHDVVGISPHSRVHDRIDNMIQALHDLPTLRQRPILPRHDQVCLIPGVHLGPPRSPGRPVIRNANPQLYVSWDAAFVGELLALPAR